MKKLRVTVDGKIFDVTVELLDETAGAPPVGRPAVAATTTPASTPAAVPVAVSPSAGGAGNVLSPLSGKIVSIDVAVGQEIEEGKQVATVEAMKMNTYVFAPRPGRVTAVLAVAGTAVEEGSALLVIG